MAEDICVIVPTIREPEAVAAYIENARTRGFDLDRLHVVFVTESFCDTDVMERILAENGVAGRIFDGPARNDWYEERDIGEFAHLIPAESHAQTSFGLLYMWAGDFEYGVFLDDDTRPHEEVDFFGQHLANLNHGGPIEIVDSDTGWVNPLYQRDGDLYPRGFPYGAMGETTTTETASVGDVVASQGLWTGIPDLDAVRILQDGDLNGQAQTLTTRTDFDRTFAVESGSYTTVCSMNLAFRREVIPAFYQFPMDDNPWEVGRFDDIWSGVLLKRAADAYRDTILTGFPLCDHQKAPRSTFDDLASEAPALELNEHLWRIVDDVDPGQLPADRADAYAVVFEAVGHRLASGEFDQWRNGDFLPYVGEYMLDWLDCLAALAPRERPMVSD
ncbi:MAG: alpha-1 4-glucan-protein synthase [Halobacteriaceae archaeon]